MIIAKWLFESTLDFHNQKFLDAKEQWENERRRFTNHIVYLQEQLKHERNRAETAIDRLLAKEAQIEPLKSQLSDLINPEGMKQMKEKEEAITAQMEKVFSEIASVGEDDIEGSPKSVVTVNGVPVGYSDLVSAETAAAD